jgi:hypothetical protein
VKALVRSPVGDKLKDSGDRLLKKGKTLELAQNLVSIFLALSLIHDQAR